MFSVAKTLGAGLGGITNFIGAKQQEEEDRQASMRQLYNDFLGGGDMMRLRAPVKKASLAAEVGKPLLSEGINSFGPDKETEERRKKGLPDPEWYEQAASGYLGAVK